jgi:tetratricopeptide (TPR) repeat protein
MDERSADSERAAGDSELPDHIVGLPDAWGLWRWLVLRSAGFPAEQVLSLSSSACAVAADQLLQAMEMARQRYDAALEALNSMLDALRADQAWEDKEKRASLLQALRCLRKDKLSKIPMLSGDAEVRIGAYRAAIADVEQARATFQAAFTVATAQTSQTIYAFAKP